MIGKEVPRWWMIIRVRRDGMYFERTSMLSMMERHRQRRRGPQRSQSLLNIEYSVVVQKVDKP